MAELTENDIVESISAAGREIAEANEIGILARSPDVDPRGEEILSAVEVLESVSLLDLIELADRQAAAGTASRTSAELIGRMLRESAVVDSVYRSDKVAGPSAATLYAAFADKVPALKRDLDPAFEVIARPGDNLGDRLEAGDILVRHALEGALAHIAILANGKTYTRDALAAAGLDAETSKEGLFAQVIETWPVPHSVADGFARRLAREDDRMARGQLILRMRIGEVLSAGEEWNRRLARFEVFYRVVRVQTRGREALQVQVNLMPAHRGRPASVPSACRGEVRGQVVPDRVFADNPPAHPEQVVRNIGGRYESRERWHPDQPNQASTMQINQAGNYVFGWWQVEQLTLRAASRSGQPQLVEMAPPMKLFFSGHITGQRFAIRLYRASGRQETPIQSTIAIQPQGLLIELPDGASLLVRTSELPRMPDHPLAQLRENNPVLVESEDHPARSGQVQGLRDFFDRVVRPYMEHYMRQRSGPLTTSRAHARSAALAALLAILNGAVGQAYPGRDHVGGRCGCKCHSDLQPGQDTGSDPASRIYPCTCDCSVRFSADQRSLEKAVLVGLLETQNIQIPGAPAMSALEVLYDMGQHAAGNEPISEGSPLGRLLLHLGLPLQIGRYRYQCRLECFNDTDTMLGVTGINLGAGLHAHYAKNALGSE